MTNIPPHPALILASSSPARQSLLKRLQIPFRIISPNIDETPLVNETPKNMVTRLAIEKAQVVAKKETRSLIISSDQVIVVNDEIMGKPLTHEKAIEQLQNASGQVCHSLNGLCLLNSATGNYQVIIEPFDVLIRTLTPEMIQNYLNLEQPYQCAGSIKCEGLGIALFEKMIGNDVTALEGLPLIQLVRLLENEGVRVV
jgi:septum formation protein